MSRESRRKQKKERQRRKQAERDARRMYNKMLKMAKENAAAADARIAEQMRIDAAARKAQQEAYSRDLLKVQTQAAESLKAMQNQYAMAEKARIERERIAQEEQAMQERMAMQQRAAEERAASTNEARAAAGATGLQIQPIERMSGAGGTGQFKRRRDQLSSSQSYGGVNTMKSGSINI